MVALYLVMGLIFAIAAASITISLGLGLLSAVLAYCAGGMVGIAVVGIWQVVRGMIAPMQDPHTLKNTSNH